MSLLKKLGQVIKANINDMLDKLEDPKKMATQEIIDLQEQLKKAQNLLISFMAQNNLLKKQLEKEPHSKIILDEIELNEQKIKTINNGINQLKLIIQGLKTNQLKKHKTATSNEKIIDVEQERDYLYDSTHFDVFDRMEEKIEQKEAIVEALKELENLSKQEEIKKSEESKTPSDLVLDEHKLKEEMDAIRKKLLP